MSGSFLCLPVVAALAAAAVFPAQAMSIVGDPFSFALSDAATNHGSTSGTALSPGTDVSDTLGAIEVEVDFIDNDTVDVLFFGNLDSDNDVTYTLSDLDYTEGGTATPITGARFNRTGSDIDDFIGDTSIGQPPASAFVEPSMSFTGTSITALFPFFHPTLQGDGVRMRYDIAFAETPAPPSAVPLPGSLPLLLGALGIVALRRRR